MELKKQLECIMLIDDDHEDNFFHQIVIERLGVTRRIEVAQNGIDALAYLQHPDSVIPELIFLDINMPKMNGWEFLSEYKNLPEARKARITIMMLSTSGNPDDISRAKEIKEVTGFQTKPLTQEMLIEIMEEHFSDHLV